MEKFRFEVFELVQVWVRQTVEIEAESKEDIMQHIKEDNLFSFYDATFEDYEVIHDTMEHQEWDYTTIEIDDIRG